MRLISLALLLSCSCTTVVINQPFIEGGPPVDYPETGSADASPLLDAVAETSLADGSDGGLDSGDASPPDASTLCSRDEPQDGICLGQTGNYNAWSCPTAKTDIASCADAGWCSCVNMWADAGIHMKCCNVSK